jgi:hypothetical protein
MEESRDRKHNTKARGKPGKKPRPHPSPTVAPTPDDLAGLPISVECEEDLTVRPRKGRSKK